MSNKSFIFYDSFYEAIMSIPENKQFQLFNAISRYALFNEIPKLDGISNTVFILVKPQIDANIKRRKDGKKGGRPPVEKEPEKEKPLVIEEKTTGYETENHRLQNEKPNVNVNVNSNVNENNKINNKFSIFTKEEKENQIFLTNQFIDHLELKDQLKDILKDWFKHLTEKGKKLTNPQIQTFISNNMNIYDKSKESFAKDIYFTIENGWMTLVRKHLELAGYDPNTGKYIPQCEGDYEPLKNPK
jgi:hypothetical protein